MSEPKVFAPTKRAKKHRKGMPKSTKGKISVLSKRVANLNSLIKEAEEIKNYDTNTVTTTLGWDFLTVQSLNGVIAQGNAVNNRSGDEIDITGLDVRYWVTNNSTSFLGLVRVLIFVDQENVLPVSQVLDGTTRVNTANAPLSFYNRSYRDKFTILYDKTHSLDITENSQYVERVHIPLKLEVKFAPGLTTVLKNMVKIAFIGNQAVATANLAYAMCSRIYYKDS